MSEHSTIAIMCLAFVLAAVIAGVSTAIITDRIWVFMTGKAPEYESVIVGGMSATVVLFLGLLYAASWGGR